MIRFIDRIEEQKILQKDWDLNKNAFIVMFGRRRIGKTTLLNHFFKDKEGLQYTAEDISKKIQIKDFKLAIANYLDDDFLRHQEITEWNNLFSYLSKTLDKNKRYYIWIDEFSYFIKSDQSVLSALQKFIDYFLRDSKIYFVISGSLFGLMSEKVLAHSSPLYGRRTRDILLKQIPARYIAKFVKFKTEDCLKTIFTINMIPEYLRVCLNYKNYADFISNEFLKTEGYFYREPIYLLSQEFKEIKTYFSILNAIAYGKNRPSEIADYVGINSKEIYPYLELLINYGFVKRETSILGNNKKGMYYISDNFFDFWFNFVYKKREQIEKRKASFKQGEIETYFGKRFEIFIRDNFLFFFKDYEQFGRWWYKDKEIDLVAINENNILFGECKWKNQVDAKEILAGLIQKSEFVKWKNEIRKESYAIFAKSFKQKITQYNGKKVHCYDLEAIKKAIFLFPPKF